MSGKSPATSRGLALASTALLVLCGCGADQPTVPDDTAVPPETRQQLEPGRPVTAQVSAGEAHTYVVPLQDGDFVHLTVVQDTVDVVARLVDPAGDAILESNSTRTIGEAEDVFAVADESAGFTLHVRTRGEGAKGSYTVTLKDRHPASDGDRAQVEALTAVIRAQTVSRSGRDGAVAEAEAGFLEALELLEGLDDPGHTALCHFHLGRIAADRGEVELALERHQRALDGWSRVEGAEHERGAVLNSIGMLNHRLGRLERALEVYDQVLEMAVASADATAEAAARLNIGAVLVQQRAVAEAADQFEVAADRAHAAGDRRLEAIASNHRGTLLWWAGLGGQAEAAFRQTRAASHDLGDQKTEANALTNLGAIRAAAGDPEAAASYFEEALSLFDRVEMARGVRMTTRKLAVTLAQQHRFDEAQQRFERLIEQAREVDDPQGICQVLTARGRAYQWAGEYGRAIAAHEEALTVARDSGDRRGESEALAGLGEALYGLGDLEQAAARLGEAMTLARELANWDEEASCLRHLALIAERSGDLEAARDHAQRAVDILESVRAELTSPDLRTSLIASRQSAYDLLIRVLERLGAESFDPTAETTALEVSERKRARTLLDHLSRTGAAVRPPADRELMRRESALRLKLGMRAATGRPGPVDDPELDRELAELEEVRAALRATDPRYAALSQGVPRTVDEIQALLGPDTLWLELAVGETASYLWLVDATSVESHVLPERRVLEDGARRLRALLRRSARGAVADEAHAAAAELGELLLGPVAHRIGASRLVIVPDGALHTIPFAVLGVDRGTASSPEPLIARNEVVMLPSASLLAVMRSRGGSRGTPEVDLAILADPVFSPDDPRVGGAEPHRRTLPDTSTAERAIPVAIQRLGRLPASRREAERIASRARDLRVTTALDFDASKSAMLAGDVTGARIVHLATHAYADLDHPERSGVVFSRVDHDGRPLDGFLSLGEIYGIELNADLVTLSACATATGREVGGEGVIGLTRGFLYAGAHAVLATLWEVDDEATAELMDRFYRGLLDEGLAPPAALRQAQLEIAVDHPRPYYWAGFVLQGDWIPRPVD